MKKVTKLWKKILVNNAKRGKNFSLYFNSGFHFSTAGNLYNSLPITIKNPKFNQRIKRKSS